ncbi:hypothetical protein NX059_011479 [Plenodomus lindquistii]|nr:hypothetical protein NX059_011479 [Plenodomus lindquistii]
MSKTNHPRILIAGGSIAGLTMANILERIGIDYLLLEKYNKIAPDLGASIGIFPNGFRILDQLGCHDTIMALVHGADAFKNMITCSEEGKTLVDIEDASKHFKSRVAYQPFFVDRQMVIQILYDNLRDKSKVLTGKGLIKVEELHESQKVQVTTSDGSKFTGDILIGADGVHSATRKEMWRLASLAQPQHFSKEEQDSTPTDYCCIFGISKPHAKFPSFSNRFIMGNKCSYLLSSGPNDRIYWFLFKKLDKTVRGIYKVPRYSEAERDALAAEHANDPMSETLTFGEVYQTHTSATLQALPEVVFAKWHYGRIITIGDAAHKFNPIGGQGGNSAIEDAAVLANHLHDMINAHESGTSFSDAEVTHLFESVQKVRHGRATMLVAASKRMQALFAKETPFTKFIAEYVVPRSTGSDTLERLCGQSRPAARIEMLPVPYRHHVDLYDDERPARPLQTNAPLYFFLAIFTALTWAANKTIVRVRSAPLPDLFLGVVPRTAFTGLSGVDAVLRRVVLIFADIVSWDDMGHTFQFLYLALFMTSILFVWYVEAWRSGNRGRLMSLPMIFGLAMHPMTIGVAAPFVFLLTIWSTGGRTSMVGRHIPERVAKSITPAILLGFALPPILMCVPSTSPEIAQDLAVIWQFASVVISGLIYIFAGNFREDEQSQYSFSDLPHMLTGYMVMFVFSIACHALAVATMLVQSGNPTMAMSRLIFPSVDVPGADFKSFASLFFAFLKMDALFAFLAVVAYGVYSVYALRFQGLITTRQAGLTCMLFLGAQVVIGPSAALVGLWWWREGRIALANSNSDVKGVIPEAVRKA